MEPRTWDSENLVTMFISTGRCSTQWLASTLGRIFATTARVEHEPLGPYYHPRAHLRQDPTSSLETGDSLVIKHIASIRESLKTGDYIETGWPCFASIPLFQREFGSQLRVVHLLRHPVATALSLLTHDLYRSGPRQDDWVGLGVLDPFVPGVLHKEYGARWSDLSPYEKCLFTWLEVNSYAEEVAGTIAVQQRTTVKMEDLLDTESNELLRLLMFLGMPEATASGSDLSTLLLELRPVIVDRWSWTTTETFDWLSVMSHPAVLELANRHGYDCLSVDPGALVDRYRSEPA